MLKSIRSRGSRSSAPASREGQTNSVLDITLGQSGTLVGSLRYFKDGDIECSSFTFDRQWLNNPRVPGLSPDLRLHAQSQWRKTPVSSGSPFFAALADTVPEGFAQSVLKRSSEHEQQPGGESYALEQLCAVHDHCRLGALRVRPRTPEDAWVGQPIELPTYVDLDAMQEAVLAFELDKADPHQRQLLAHSATALGGWQPKVSFLMEGGMLGVAKFARAKDRYPVVQAEMLASQLAKAAGIRVVDVQLKRLRHGPALIAPRFDRDAIGKRKAYLSASGLLLAEEGEEVSCHELLARMKACCTDFAQDAHQLWSRVLFKRLIGNADARLHRIGFLYAGRGRWQLAPATGLKPGGKSQPPSTAAHVRELSPDCTVTSLLGLAPAFGLREAEALDALAAMVKALDRWPKVASEFAVGMTKDQIDLMDKLLNNEHLLQARELVGVHH